MQEAGADLSSIKEKMIARENGEADKAVPKRTPFQSLDFLVRDWQNFDEEGRAIDLVSWNNRPPSLSLSDLI